jgi:hypothetical protein
MKSLLLVITALLSLAASGQAWERDATPTEDAWFKVQTLTKGEPDAVAEHLTSHGMTIEKLAALRDYAADSQKRLDELELGKIKHICDNRSKYDDDAEALARQFEQMEVDTAAFKQGILDRLPEVIGQADAMSFQSFVRHEPVSRVGGVDRAGFLRSGQVSAKEYIDRACVIPKETP